MPKPVVLVAVAAIVLTPFAAAAQSSAPDRYSMEKTEKGIVRMDRKTGEMTLCHIGAGKLVCGSVEDGMSALEKRVARLEAEVAKLTGKRGDVEGSDADSSPGDRSLDRAMNTVERLVYRLFRMVDDLNRDFRKPSASPDGSAAGPQKT